MTTNFVRFPREPVWVGQKGLDSSCLRPARWHQPLLALSPVPPCLLVNFSSSLVSKQRLLSAAAPWLNSVRLTTLRQFQPSSAFESSVSLLSLESHPSIFHTRFF